ncbi:hypothetical protein MASR2M78_30540 [Treponema sp.]
MRIVYKATPERSVPHLTNPLHTKGEKVLVISAHKESRRVEAKKTEPDMQISDEALARNREVRSHENAHMAALGGAAASPILYDEVRGPGGEKIAVGGKIAVDLSEVPGDPEASLRKARNIISAAYAPGEPSAADMRTAARAYDLARKAQEEIRAQYSGIETGAENILT